METISDSQPILIWLAKKEEEIAIAGYNQIFRNDRSRNSGCIILAVKENIKAFTLEVGQEKEMGQSLWLLPDNNRRKIKTGLIYASQENVTSTMSFK